MKTQFLTEWSERQLKAVEKKILVFIKSRWFETMHGGENKDPFIGCRTFEDIDNILGLAYTSSSSFAGLWACNTHLYLDAARDWYLNGFAMDKNGFVFAIWNNDEEAEAITPIN